MNGSLKSKVNIDIFFKDNLNGEICFPTYVYVLQCANEVTVAEEKFASHETNFPSAKNVACAHKLV